MRNNTLPESQLSLDFSLGVSSTALHYALLTQQDQQYIWFKKQQRKLCCALTGGVIKVSNLLLILKDRLTLVGVHVVGVDEFTAETLRSTRNSAPKLSKWPNTEHRFIIP